MSHGDQRFSAEELESGRLLFAGPVEFLLGAAALQQLPAELPVEVAFAGRSNVGKSSLLNALTNRKDLARTSNTPGRTRELNCFRVGGQLAMVDMPGYGYAKAQKTLVAKWQALVRAYLRGRPNLRRVFVLIDARHGIKTTDEATLALLDRTAVSYQIVLTKADKIKSDELNEIIGRTHAGIKIRPAAHPELHVTSSVKVITDKKVIDQGGAAASLMLPPHRFDAQPPASRARHAPAPRACC